MRKGVPIAEGKRICQEFRAPMCVLFTIHDNGDSFNVMSYGMTRALCRHAADIANKISEAILGSKIVPAGSEPLDLPDYPEGWVKDSLPVRCRALVHRWRERELECRSDSEDWRGQEYRELLLELAEELEDALNVTSKEPAA